MIYFAVDMETGGFEDRESLLQIYFEIYDNIFFNPLFKFKSYIRPEAKTPFVCELEALHVNKIDLSVIDDTNSITERELKDLIVTKKMEFYPSQSFTLVGQNPWIEARRFRKLFGEVYVQQVFDRRPLDTASTAKFLQAKGAIPETMKVSLENLITYFGIPIPEGLRLHDAETDTRLTVEVLRRMLKL